MATKAQLINFIIEMFTEADGNEVSRSKLETFKKSDLEEFIKSRDLTSALEEWLAK